uniref:CSON007020 protein n=1 Tax=Culicoides sonorensis TaxID=179676 RepID=A0A336M2H3_CULSO
MLKSKTAVYSNQKKSCASLGVTYQKDEVNQFWSTANLNLNEEADRLKTFRLFERKGDCNVSQNFALMSLTGLFFDSSFFSQ